MICAPLVSGFASLPGWKGWSGCGDYDNDLQALLSHAPADDFPAGVDPSTITCSSMVSACDDAEAGFTKVICADSCQYHGPCTGDGALAVLFSKDNEVSDMTCATLPLSEAIMGALVGGITSDAGDGSDPTAEELAIVPTMFSIGRKICGLPPATAARRARKMTDARPVDASKVHKLAAAMLRATKTMAHRLA